MPERGLLQNRHYNRIRSHRYPTLGEEPYKRLIYDPGLVTRIIMNRPRYLNTTSHAHIAELEDVFDRAAEDDKCNVIVLSGAGTCFCSGDDNTGLTPESAPTLCDGDDPAPGDYNGTVVKLIEEYGSETAVWNEYNIEHDHLVGWWQFNKLRTHPKPTIAMVHGWAIFFGFGLTVNTDLLFASEDAMFLGGGADGTSIFDFGRRRALEFSYEHRVMTPSEGYERGFVNRVFPDYETLEKETMAFAYRVAFESPINLRRSKEGYLNAMDDLGITQRSEDRQAFRVTWRQDAIEGHRMRYEGKGRARSPVALRNLRAKLVSQGQEVPMSIRAAIARADARDDKATWQRALHQPWRSADRLARTDTSAQAYADMRSEWEETVASEIARRGMDPSIGKVNV